MRYFQGRLCDKIGLLCDKLCDFFRANLHCFARFQRRKTTLMLFDKFECKGMIKHLFIKFKAKWLNLSDNFYPEKKKDTCLVLDDAVTPLTTYTACLRNQNGCPDTAIEGFRCLARLSFVVNHLKL